MPSGLFYTKNRDWKIQGRMRMNSPAVARHDGRWHDDGRQDEEDEEDEGLQQPRALRSFSCRPLYFIWIKKKKACKKVTLPPLDRLQDEVRQVRQVWLRLNRSPREFSAASATGDITKFFQPYG
jgi:hypothetical protein